MSSISVGGTRLYETQDPRVRVGFYGVDNWRTVVQGEGGEWDTITGPPHRSKTGALADVAQVARSYFATAAELDEHAASATGQLRAEVARLTRVSQLLNAYGHAILGDTWWPGNAAAYLPDGRGQELEQLLEASLPQAEPGEDYWQTAMGQLELFQRANIELRERIEAAMAIANGTSSYQKAQRMAEALAGHAEGEAGPVPAPDGNAERTRTAQLRMARARHRGRVRAELDKYDAEVDAINARYQASVQAQ